VKSYGGSDFVQACFLIMIIKCMKSKWYRNHNISQMTSLSIF